MKMIDEQEPHHLIAFDLNTSDVGLIRQGEEPEKRGFQDQLLQHSNELMGEYKKKFDLHVQDEPGGIELAPEAKEWNEEPWFPDRNPGRTNDYRIYAHEAQEWAKRRQADRDCFVFQY